jgi:hypothetical protein
MIIFRRFTGRARARTLVRLRKHRASVTNPTSSSIQLTCGTYVWFLTASCNILYSTQRKWKHRTIFIVNGNNAKSLLLEPEHGQIPVANGGMQELARQLARHPKRRWRRGSLFDGPVARGAQGPNALYLAVPVLLEGFVLPVPWLIFR